MEYVNERGAFDDLPLAQIEADFRRVYAGWLPDGASVRSELAQGDFLADVAREAPAPGSVRSRPQ